MLVQVVGKRALKALVDKADVGEAESKDNVIVKLDEILNGHEDSLESILNNILAHLATGSDGNGVSVDHAEALLEDALL